MTLVEVLIAMAVFSVGLLGIMPMFLYSTAQSRLQKDKEVIAQVVVDWMAKMDAMAWDDIEQAKIEAVLDQASENSTPSDGNDPGFSGDWGHFSGQRDIQYQVRIDIDDSDDSNTWEDGSEGDGMPGYDFRRYTIEVRWKSLTPKEHSVVVSKLRMKKSPINLGM